ncbi:MAG: rhodanese-like domain-containing protein [Gammaproteobacteria bacterium]|nr:rhodanese-like domain-containing protein [Gammaproteobacteria bacterium]
MTQNFRLIATAVCIAVLSPLISSLAVAGELPNPRSVEVGPPLTCEQIEMINAVGTEVFFIIDARSPSEYDDAHVPGAMNIPYDSLDFFVDELPESKDAMIVTYCRSGGRATVLQGLLNELGYTNVSVVPGSQMDRSREGRLGFTCGD